MSLQLATRILHVKDGNSYDTIDILRGPQGEDGKAYYGTSSSAKSALTKVVVCEGFELVEGARIIVRFTASEDYSIVSGQVKLNVNGTGAKNIKYKNSIETFSSIGDKLCDYRTYEFVYDGTYYIVVGDFDTNTTYMNLTQSAIDVGTDTTGKVISAKVLHDALANAGGSITVDDDLDDTSENPVQNKVINSALNGKLTAESGNVSYSISNSKALIQYDNGSDANGVDIRSSKAEMFASSDDGISSIQAHDVHIGLNVQSSGGDGNALVLTPTYTQITKVKTPTDSGDAVPKSYVDSNLEAKADVVDLAPVYSTSGTYAVGDYVTYNGNVYRCTTAITTAEAWTAAHWTQVAIGDEVSSVIDDLRHIKDGIFYVTPEQFGAVGDGVTDDSQAVQDACDAGYNIYFESNKTYYLASEVTIDHDIYLHGGENTVIRTQSVTTSGTVTLNRAFHVSGKLKKTTSLTTDYTTAGNTDNSSNKFTFADMAGIEIGDLIDIIATDQPYSYARPYYYLGATLLVSDIYDGHIFTTDIMPWDIENTEDVSVEIYDAPEVIIENLNFVSDRAQVGFRFTVELDYCKNSIVRNCNMQNAWNHLRLSHSYNCMVDSVQVALSKYDNSLGTDSYGICVISCTNTVVQRIHSISSQHTIEVGGDHPSINTYIRYCTVSSECRMAGIDTHESVYNTVIEDCTLGGMSIFGVVTISRCKFIKNNLMPATANSLTIYGHHNPKLARAVVEDCTFYDGMFVSFPTGAVQNPLQAFDHIIDKLTIRNCKGGYFFSRTNTTAYILSNKINTLVIDGWEDCDGIQHEGTIFKNILVKNTNFVRSVWIWKAGSTFDFSDVQKLRYIDEQNGINRLCVNTQDEGGIYKLPSGVQVNLSSSNNSAHYTICGKNLVPNNLADLAVGSVTGSPGGNISRTVNANFNNSINIDNGDIVFTQPNNTTKVSIYPLCYTYVSENSKAKLQGTLKNIGDTAGAYFMPFVTVVNCETGKLVDRYSFSSVQATAEGANFSVETGVSGNRLVLLYLYCSSAVANSVTKFENYMASIAPMGFPSPLHEEYSAVRRDGDGSLLSVDGVNNIQSSELYFNVEFKADF